MQVKSVFYESYLFILVHLYNLTFKLKKLYCSFAKNIGKYTQ